jgi:dynein heavy chain
MQDSLLFVVKKSYYNLRDYIFSFIPIGVSVKNACEVTNVFVPESQLVGKTPQEIDKIKKKSYVEPLFLLDLVKAKEDEFAFSTAPVSFVNMIVHLFEKPLEDVAKIPDLEPKILSDLYKAIKNETFIKAPMKPREKPVDPDPKVVPRKLPDENKWIWDIIE